MITGISETASTVQSKTVRATVMQVPRLGELEVLNQVAIEIDGDGVIAAIHHDDRLCDLDLGKNVVLLPGLVDTHIHAPQWPQLGTGLDLPLEKWLLEHTFPLEARLTEPAFAAVVWPALVSTLLAHGTTTAVYYATINVETTTMLAATCAELGQRAFVGRVAMDHPDGTPTNYRDASVAAAVDASFASIEAINDIRSSLVRPIITPRFTPACTDAALAGLGDLAASTGVIVQTHCSESDWQHGYANERFGMSDTEALAGFGLMRDHTVLAHGDHLSGADFGIVGAAGSGVAHCPLSNAYFANAVFPLRRALDAGVRVGLGTDIAGGSKPGVLSQCADAVTASQMLHDGVDASIEAAHRGVAGSRVSIVDAFHVATRGGADLLGINAGALDVGRLFDAIAVSTARPGSALQIWREIDDDARRFEKIVRLATPQDIEKVWVGGTQVAGTGGP